MGIRGAMQEVGYIEDFLPSAVREGSSSICKMKHSTYPGFAEAILAYAPGKESVFYGARIMCNLREKRSLAMT